MPGRDAARTPTKQIRPPPHGASGQRVEDVEALHLHHPGFPETVHLFVVEVRQDDHRPLEPFRAVIGQDVHGVAGGDDRLQVEFRGARLLEPEQEAGQAGGFVLGRAVLLVEDREVEQRVEIPLALRGFDAVGSPGGHRLADAHVVEHADHGLEGRQRRGGPTQRSQAPHDRLSAVPVPAFPAVREPGEAVREPRLRGVAPGERHHLRDGQRVAVVVQATQARPRESDLGDGEEAAHGHLHGNALTPQRARDPLHARVRPGEYGDIAVAHRADCPALGVHDGMAAFNKIGDSGRQGGEALVEAVARKGPAGDGGRLGGGFALRCQHDARGIQRPAEGRREDGVQVVHQGCP